MNEKQLQIKLREYLSNPGFVHKNQAGESFQILSIGRLNVHEGPDFIDIAILKEGMIYVGDAEYDIKCSYWKEHGHHKDPNFENVILHIISERDIEEFEQFDTLLVKTDELINLDSNKLIKTDTHSLEDLQQYALIRILRKSYIAKKYLNSSDIRQAQISLLKDFFDRYFSRRRRPIYKKENTDIYINKIINSNVLNFINSIKTNETINIINELEDLLDTNMFDEGVNFRREIILNGVLPLAVCLSNAKQRSELFIWYWSAKALNQYGKLSRRFPELSQKYLWQQQGMLELLNEIGHKDRVAEIKKEYGFASILDFYSYGNIK